MLEIQLSILGENRNKMIIRMQIKKLSNVMYAIFVFSVFLKFLPIFHDLFSAITIITIITGNLCLLVTSLRAPLNSAATIFWGSLVVMVIITALSQKNEIIISIPQATSNMGFALLFARSPPGHQAQLALISLMLFFFFYHIAIKSNPEDIFTVSRNYISVIIVLVAGFYLIACEEENRRPMIVVLIFFLLITMWAIGRAGMASAMIILIGALIFKIDRVKMYVTIVLSIIIVGAFFFAQNISSQAQDNQISIFLTGIERFHRLGTADYRSHINREYIQRINEYPSEALVGAPVERIGSIVAVDGNPHNSYIRLHTMAGLAGFLLVMTTVFFAIFKLSMKKKGLTIIALVACLFRSAFDSAAFHGPLDVVIYYSIFSALINIRIINRVARKKINEISKNIA